MRLMPERLIDQPPHVLPPAAVVAHFGTDPVRGLTRSEAVRRLTAAGPNELPAAARVPAWRMLLAQGKNVLIMILLVAIGLSLVLGHTTEAVAIAVIALFSVVLGFIQERRAERALEALRRMSAPYATVMRDGEADEVPSRDLVPGDIILLEAGDIVPADARLLEAINLRIDEAALTGESSPVGKCVEALPESGIALGDRKNLAFSSTAVTYGRGRAVVIATGQHTEIGTINALLSTVTPAKTPIEAHLDRVGRWLAHAALVVVALVVALGLLRGLPVMQMVIFSIALAVAVVPEALPAVVTISLALGAQRMVKRNALVRRLPTVETLGSTTIICSDKTGTLTTGEMTVRELFVAGVSVDVTGVGYAPQGWFMRDGQRVEPDQVLHEVLTAAALCTDAHLRQAADGRWRITGDPTEGALLTLAAKAHLTKGVLESAEPRVAEIPFSSERKHMTTLHGRDPCTAYAKGAPEVILAACTRLRTVAGEASLSHETRAQILAAARGMGQRALRVLAIARRHPATLETAECEMTFLGLIGMLDAPRPEAHTAIQTCHAAGIRPVMITGDHPVTACAVAEELGLLRHGGVITGSELAAVSDAELEQRVAALDVYARVSPADKLRVVAALQRRQDIVAMTGDGVNDAPALKKADIGIAMGITGTDVAKEAAAMTLTDDNFASIVAAVEEGRAIFDNIKKYLMYLLSSNVGEIALMAGAMVLGLPIPLTAVQILYVNLATDGLPALALAVDPPAPDLMRRRPHTPGSGLFSRPVVVLILLGGCWSALVNVALFAWALATRFDVREAMTMTFVSLVLIQFCKAYSFRSERHTVFQGTFENRWLNGAVLWELALLGLIIYVPILQAPFGTFPLPLVDWLILVGAALTIVPVLEMAKWLERRGWFGPLE